MKNQSTNNSIATTSNKNRFTESKKNISGKKSTRYVYTEEDLGEGILDAGVPSSYSMGQEHKTNPQNKNSRPNAIH